MQTLQAAKANIVTASTVIEKNYRYACGAEVGGWTDYADYSRCFFNSPDGQNIDLHIELKRLGYRHHKYAAPYHWAVRKDGIEVEYVEGDVYVRLITL